MADETPASDALADARARFARGDFRGAYREASAVVARGPEAGEAAAARALLASLAPDPWAIRVGLAALALLVAVVVIYIF